MERRVGGRGREKWIEGEGKRREGEREREELTSGVPSEELGRASSPCSHWARAALRAGPLQ